MAGELVVNDSLQFTKGNVLAVTRVTVNNAVNVAGTNYQEGTQSFTTAPAAFNLGGVVTVGYMWVKNLDATNQLFIRSASGAADTIQLNPGESCQFRSATSTPYGKSSTGTVAAEYLIIEA